MQVRYYSHASFQLKAESGKTLLTDPWVFNPIYGSTIWQFPECNIPLSEFIRQDALYISHDHPDHFCPRTLDLFPRETPIIIRRYSQDVSIKGQLARIGFSNIVELEHLESTNIVDGMTVTLFADAASSDSLILADDGEHVVMDQNDCLLTEDEYRTIGEKFDIDLAFLFYSGASIYPARFDISDAEKLTATNKRIESQFEYSLNTGRLVGAKIVVPGANDLCQFRSAEYDSYASALPVEYRNFINSRQTPFEVLLMVPGEIHNFTEPAGACTNYFPDRRSWIKAVTELRERADVRQAAEKLIAWEISFTFDSKIFLDLFGRFCAYAGNVQTRAAALEDGLSVGLKFEKEDGSAHSFIVHYYPDNMAIEQAAEVSPSDTNLHMVLTVEDYMAGMCMAGAQTWEDLLNNRWFVQRPHAEFTVDELNFWEFLTSFTPYLERIKQQPKLYERGQLQMQAGA